MKTKYLLFVTFLAAALLEAIPVGAEQDLRVDNLPQEILSKLGADEELADRPMNLKVSSQNGHVVLQGFVNDSAERDLVTRKVARMEGVKRVENRLKIKRQESDLLEPLKER